MNILIVESRYNSVEEMDALYNSFTDAEVDVGHASEIDIDDVRDDYDTVLSEVILDHDLKGPDILDKFKADKKALYTTWRRDEADDYPELQEALDQYNVIHKPTKHMDLKRVVQEEMTPD
jgi:hypothetical protein